MTPAVYLILCAFAIWRVTRFLIRDALIDEPRFKLEAWLAKRSDKKRYQKLMELIACPWCVSIYIAAGVTALYVLAIHPGLGWAEIGIVWLGLAGAAMAAWRTWEND